MGFKWGISKPVNQRQYASDSKVEGASEFDDIVP